MSALLKNIKRGFLSGLKFFLELNPNTPSDIDEYKNHIHAGRQKDISDHWMDVGDYLRDGMLYIESSSDFKDALNDVDAHKPLKLHERREETRKSSRERKPREEPTP